MGPVHIQRLGGGADQQTRERTETVDARDLVESWVQSADVPTEPSPHQGHDSVLYGADGVGVDEGHPEIVMQKPAADEPAISSVVKEALEKAPGGHGGC